MNVYFKIPKDSNSFEKDVQNNSIHLENQNFPKIW